MARYHGLLVLLSTMCVYYCLTSLDAGRRRDLVAYSVTTFLMLMTYYLSLFVIVAEVLVILLHWRKHPHLKAVFVPLALAVGCFHTVVYSWIAFRSK